MKPGNQLGGPQMSDQDLEQMLCVRELYSEILGVCLESETEAVDILVALTLALRDLAVRYHGPDSACSRSIDALEHSFALDVPVWPQETLH